MANITSTQGAQSGRRVRPASGPGLDFATLLGTFGAFVVIGIAMWIGGSLNSFIDVPAILIVIGGTFLVTMISYTLDEVTRAQSVMLRAIVYHSEQPGYAALRVLQIAEEARANGMLSLQTVLPNLRNNRFLYRAIGMLVDGAPTDEVEKVLNVELRATSDRHVRSAGILRRAAEVAPAMGLIGTLIGLVQMLGNLDDPSAIGPAMAVALLTTFYGAILANMVFMPVANKLERNSQMEIMVNQIYALGAASISRQENPRRLELLLNTVLPPAQRVRYFD